MIALIFLWYSARYLAKLVEKLRVIRTEFPEVDTKLIISVARHSGLASASENIDIAIERHLAGCDIVCGVELGGTTTASHWTNFEPLFAKARRAGLQVALHCGEHHGGQSEWCQMIEWRPDRLGHCVYLDPTNMNKLIRSGVPVETAPTCHERVFVVPCQCNVFAKLHPHNQVTIATDNPHFIGITLSDEYALCAAHHHLTIRQLVQLARRSIDFIFAPNSTKTMMKAQFDQRWRQVAADFGVSPFDPSMPCENPKL